MNVVVRGEPNALSEKSRPGRLLRAARAYLVVLEWLAIGAIALMTLVAGLQVFYRYVLGDSLFWSEELMRYLMIWTAYLCAGLAYTREEMLGMRFAVDACPQRLRVLIDWVGRLLVVAMLCTVAWYGYQFAAQTTAEEAVALEVSMAWMHAAVPIGAALMALHVLFTGFFKQALSRPAAD